MPVLLDDQDIVLDWAQEGPFPTAPFPQDWIVGKDGTLRYFNNRFEHDSMVEAIERELEK